MNLTPAPPPYQTVLDANGDAVSGAKIYTMSAGGVWPGNALATYADAAGSTLNPNPIVADAAGRYVAFWLPTAYKVLVTDASDVTIKTIDNLLALSGWDANVDIDGIAGENLSARDAVYLSDGTGGTTAGRWYKTDADAVASSSGAGAIGMASADIASGATGAIRLQGRLTGFVGLTPGADYFVSATAGGITTTAPSNRRFVGVSDLSTSLVIQPTNSETAALVAGAFSVTGQAQYDLLYASSASQWARIAGAASAVLVTDGSKVPTLSTTPTLPKIMGAGIAPSAWAWGTTGAALEMGFVGSALYAHVNGSISLIGGAYWSTSQYLYANSTTAPARWYVAAGGVGYETAAAGTAGNPVSFATVFSVSAAGVMTVSGFGTHVLGAGGTGADTLTLKLYGSSAASRGPMVSFFANATEVGLIGRHAAIFAGGSTSDALSIYASAAAGMELYAADVSGAITFAAGGTTANGDWTPNGSLRVGLRLAKTDTPNYIGALRFCSTATDYWTCRTNTNADLAFDYAELLGPSVTERVRFLSSGGILINGKAFTFGANDSYAAGFRTVCIENA
jgi:hypothetical protein